MKANAHLRHHCYYMRLAYRRSPNVPSMFVLEVMVTGMTLHRIVGIEFSLDLHFCINILARRG